METTNTPILAYGTFGLHIIQHCSGQGFHFIGTIPEQLTKECWRTQEEMISVFFKWLDTLSIADKKECIPLLRNDIFAQYLNR